MLDHFHLPIVPGRDVQMFTLPSTVTNLQWSTWTKPRGLSMAYMLLIGGGGGGGRGLAGIAGTARGGGGGGAGSAMTKILMPLEFLPDRLFVQVGGGGVGASDPATNAGPGLLSVISLYTDSGVTNTIGQSGGAGATGGANGSNGGNAAGGTAGTVAVLSNMSRIGLGHHAIIAGQSGSTGGSPTSAGTALAIPTTSVLCMGGTGGGGVTVTTNFAGGAITVISNSLLSQFAPAAAPAGPGGHGSGGPQLWKPFFSFGGMGGSSSDSVIPSGDGGKGSYGSGGGGGGGGIGNAAAENSPGGFGGNGIVIISCW